MTDPAVEAAQRALGVKTLHPAHRNADYLTLAAAREALKPIRELIEMWESTGLLDYAKLKACIYSSDELER